MVAAASDTLGPLSVLVANAGVMIGAPIDEMTSAQWQQSLDTNLTGVFNAIRAVTPTMRQHRYGRIVVISSCLGRAPMPNTAAYSASKWGLIGLTKAAAHDLAAFGVTVNTVAPGNVRTPMVDNEPLARLFRPDLAEPTIEDMLPALAKMNPMRVALLDPEEVSRAVLFLADPASAHISGIVLDVNAGSSASYSS